MLQKRSSIFSHRTFGFWNVYIMRLCTLARRFKMILFLSFSARRRSFHQSTIHFSTISFYTWHSLYTLIYLFIQFFFLFCVAKMFSLIFSIWFLSRYSQFRFFIQAFHRAFNHFTNFPHLNLFDNSIFFCYFFRMTFVKANMGEIRSRPLCCGLKCILRLHSVIFFFHFHCEEVTKQHHK